MVIADIDQVGVLGPTGSLEPWPADIVKWLRQRDDLAAQEPQTVTVGGLEARQIDVVTQYAPAAGEPAQLPLIQPEEHLGFGGSVPLVTEETAVWRLIELESGTDTLLILLMAPEDDFENWTVAADEVLETLSLP